MSRNKKIVYDLDTDSEGQQNDLISTTLANSRINDTEQLNEYYLGQRDYEYLLGVIQSQSKPFENVTFDINVIKTLPVGTDLETVVNNLEDFYSSVAKNEIVRRKRFLMQKHNISLTSLRSTDDKNIFIRKPAKENDIIDISSFLMLPLSFAQYGKINLNTTNILQLSLIHI